MTTLHTKQLNFNQNVSISNDGGQISSDTGLLVVQEFLDAIGFDHLLKKIVLFHEQRKFWSHPKDDLLKQIILQLIAGYPADSAANQLRHDPIMKLIFGHTPASQPTLSRFISAINQTEVHQLLVLAQALADMLLNRTNQQSLVIDVDSTHSDTFGHQEKTDYNAHYQTNGYHPLVAFDGLTGVFLSAQLRPGSVYTSTGAADFLRPLISHYKEFPCDMPILIRGDSGFATPEIYQLCEEKKSYFVIRLKKNMRLQKAAEQLMLYGDQTDFDKKEVIYHEISYQAQSWPHDYRVVVKSTREASEYLFDHTFIVTNLRAIKSEQIFQLYQKRGTMENFIKEIKNGFSFDKTDSSTFQANSARMMISGVAYNIMHLMKMWVLPDAEKSNTITTLRFKLLHIAGRITLHARKIQVHLANSNVYDSLFWQVLNRVQRLELMV